MPIKQKFCLILLIVLSGLLTNCSKNIRLQPFTSDGCSMFPDQSLMHTQDWSECCYSHDLTYWRGGTEKERRIADSLFKECIIKKTNNKHLAELMYNGVRLGGSPFFPTWYRWGYGWNYMRGYKPFTQEEQKLIQIRLQEFQKETEKNRR